MSLLRLIAIATLSLAVCGTVRAATAEVTINVIEARGEGIEFILAHTDGASFQTRALKKSGERTWRWDIGTPHSDVYFYWNFFHGVADIWIRIDGTTIFSGRCAGDRTKNTRLADTCRRPKTYKRAGYPSIREPRDEPISILTLKSTNDAS
jgi:hypothetical protein